MASERANGLFERTLTGRKDIRVFYEIIPIGNIDIDLTKGEDVIRTSNFECLVPLPNEGKEVSRPRVTSELKKNWMKTLCAMDHSNDRRHGNRGIKVSNLLTRDLCMILALLCSRFVGGSVVMISQCDRCRTWRDCYRKKGAEDLDEVQEIVNNPTQLKRMGVHVTPKNDTIEGNGGTPTIIEARIVMGSPTTSPLAKEVDDVEEEMFAGGDPKAEAEDFFNANSTIEGDSPEQRLDVVLDHVKEEESTKGEERENGREDSWVGEWKEMMKITHMANIMVKKAARLEKDLASLHNGNVRHSQLDPIEMETNANDPTSVPVASPSSHSHFVSPSTSSLLERDAQL
eukprot:Gb_20235 [translate_table: standard]